MSSSTDIIYGRGFDTTNIKTASKLAFIEKRKQLISDHFGAIGDTLLNIIKNMDKTMRENAPNLDNDMIGTNYNDLYNAICACEGHDDREGNDIIALIMTNETGIGYSYEPAQDGCEGEPCILLIETKPWYYNDIEKSLSEQKFDSITQQYTKELEIPNADIEDKKIEYFG